MRRRFWRAGSIGTVAGQADPRIEICRVSGHCAKPGFMKCRWYSMREVLLIMRAECGWRQLKAFAPSGPSSGYLPAAKVDVRLDFKALAEADRCSGRGDRGLRRYDCMLDMR